MNVIHHVDESQTRVHLIFLGNTSFPFPWCESCHMHTALSPTIFGQHGCQAGKPVPRAGEEKCYAFQLNTNQPKQREDTGCSPFLSGG